MADDKQKETDKDNLNSDSEKRMSIRDRILKSKSKLNKKTKIQTSTNDSNENANTETEAKNQIKDENSEQIKILTQKLKEAEEREKRLLAEFMNYRQRSQKENINAYDNGAIEAITKLLLVLDNLERALNSISEQEKDNNYYKGIEMIIKQFLSLLSDLQVEEIKVNQGDNFNHEMHYAVAHIEDEKFGENTVVDIYEKGYKYKEKVIRYTKVRVAN